MRKVLLSLLLICGLQGLKAQSDADFEKVAQDLLVLLTDTSELPRLEYIRIKTYREMVDQQNWTYSEKEEYKYDIEAKYGLEYELFHKKLGLLVERYYLEAHDGAEAEYLSSSYQAKANFKNTYQAEMRFLYSYKGMQSTVSLHYELFYNGRGLGFFGPPIMEEF
tara:strand:+ start:2048 stop:2542 length:495 start_codon:yes stop_codon:yes gene_type:complete